MQSARHVSSFADMPVSLTISTDELKAAVRNAIQEDLDRIVTILRYVGEMCVNEARQHGSYKDQTGNLRSSTGYVVVVNGQIQDEGGFEGVLQTAEDGPTEGKEFARQLASRVADTDLALIVVAGMNYALYVQAKGYNVLSSAEQLAKDTIPGMLNRLFNENRNTGTE